VPLLLALWVLFTYWRAGINARGGGIRGLGRYLRDELFPESLRKMPFMYIIVTPIELLQLLIIRPASLTIRLVANMVVGHITLLLCFAATQYFAFRAHGAMHAFAALTLFGGIFMTLFEMLVAFLQAYIFTLLATVYIDLALETEEEEPQQGKASYGNGDVSGNLGQPKRHRLWHNRFGARHRAGLLSG